MLDSITEVTSLQVVKIMNPFDYGYKGKLQLTTNNNLLPQKQLISIAVKYAGPQKYKWRGQSMDKTVDITLIRNSTGTSGTIINTHPRKFYRILPLDTIHSVLIKIDDVVTPCNHDSTGVSAADPVVFGDCDGVCPGHIDILIVVTPEANQWLASNSTNSIELMMSDLESAFYNSNIPHTLAYQTVNLPLSLSFTPNDCQSDAITFSGNSQIQGIRALYGSDLVVVLALPSIYTQGALACVADIGPISNRSTAIVPVDLGLLDHIFTHEVGHLFGGKHLSYPKAPNPQCAFAHALLFPPPIYALNTVMGGATYRILHFSDPEIMYQGIATGVIGTENNAGYIRSTGCIVQDFAVSQTINPIITAAEDHCQIALSATLDGTVAGITYDWYWNTTGIFLGNNPSTYLGSGANLTVDDPLPDPCESYFIHLKVKLYGDEIGNTTINHGGGICMANVQCDGGPVTAKSRQNMVIETKNNNQTFLNHEIESVTINKAYRLYNTLGQLILSTYDYSEIKQKTSQNLPQLYIIMIVVDGEMISTYNYFSN